MFETTYITTYVRVWYGVCIRVCMCVCVCVHTCVSVRWACVGWCGRSSPSWCSSPHDERRSSVWWNTPRPPAGSSLRDTQTERWSDRQVDAQTDRHYCDCHGSSEHSAAMNIHIDVCSYPWCNSVFLSYPEPGSSSGMQCHRSSGVQASRSPKGGRTGWWRGWHVGEWRGRLCSTSLGTWTTDMRFRKTGMENLCVLGYWHCKSDCEVWWQILIWMIVKSEL